MSRYINRLRSLEGRLGVGECSACGSSQCVVVWLTDEHPDYHQPGCALCGQEPLMVVWDMRSGDELLRSQQVPTATTHPSSGPAERVAAPTGDKLTPVPRVRRRRYSG